MKRLILASLLSLASIGAHAANMTLVCYGPAALPVTACASPQWHNPGAGQPVSTQAGWIAYSATLSTPILTCNAAAQPGAGQPQSACAVLNQVYVAPAPATAKTFSVPITWTNPTTDAAGNTVALTATSVYRGTSAGALTLIKVIVPPATSYTDTGVAAGTYFYGVSATDAAGESDQATGSYTVTAPIVVGVPKAPTNLAVGTPAQ